VRPTVWALRLDDEAGLKAFIGVSDSEVANARGPPLACRRRVQAKAGEATKPSIPRTGPLQRAHFPARLNEPRSWRRSPKGQQVTKPEPWIRRRQERARDLATLPPETLAASAERFLDTDALPSTRQRLRQAFPAMPEPGPAWHGWFRTLPARQREAAINHLAMVGWDPLNEEPKPSPRRPEPPPARERRRALPRPGPER